MDVGNFLRELGLQQYEAAFRDNRIDIRVLPKLTAEDLKDLGVTLVGDRRMLIDAIAALREPTAPAAKAGGDVLDAGLIPGTEAASTAEAERRPLSVMFCDLIGSTALSARLDPEDLREVIRTYQACVATTIRQYDGFIARYVGDGVLIYFGWPEARETDAERAVRAGLAVAAAVSASPVNSEPLQVRVGIATGLVVIGEPIGSGDSRQQTAVGETPNLAARLQGFAGPDQVVIDAATRRQIGGLFECQDLGTVELKGLPVAVPVWRVLSENRTLGQFEALRSGTTLLVGRDEEMDQLLRRWAQAKTGSGKVVLISAEPGVGKSRLTEALAGRIAAEPHTRLRYFCSPHHQDSALYPVIAQMERAAGFQHGDEPAARLAKLQELLAATVPAVEDVALIADLHALPSADLAPRLDVTPQRKKEKTFEALLRQVEGLARQKPVLMMFDDIHWIDPSSRELLDRVIERVADRPVLLIAMFRPEFPPPWIGQPHVTMMTLARLDRRDTAAMVANVAGNAALPLKIIEEIAEHTDGVPLFVEELTKAVLESGVHGVAALSSVPVPATLHASLMARLDRLGPAAKEVAQTGAAIGREFEHELLASVVDLPEPQLREALDRLTNAGLLFVRGTSPQSSYLFKHALVQDAAYGTLLRSRRQRMHARIAATLEDRFSEIVLTQPALLAQHCAAAGLAEQAVGYWHKAGQQAAQHSAHAESITYLTKGLKALASLPDTLEHDQLELALQTTLGPVLMATQGYASPDAGQAYHRAYELCSQLGEAPQIFQILLGLRQFHHIGGALQRARELGEQLLELALKMQNPPFLVQAHTMLGHTLCYTGEFVNAQAHLEKAVALYDRQQHHAHILLSGLDPGVLCRGASAWVLWHLGYPDQALERAHAGISLAIELTHSQSLAQALGSTGQLHQFRREQAATLAHAEREIAVASERGFQMRLAMATVLRGWALVGEAEKTQGIAQMHQALAAYRATGAGASNALYLSLLAQGYEQGQQITEAHSALEEAFTWVRKSGERWCDAELHRLKGTLLLHQMIPDNLQAECSFQQALDIARRQQAKSWELRASTSLARLWRDQGKCVEARDLLGPIYHWFTEGFDAPDLKDAKALLDELA